MRTAACKDMVNAKIISERIAEARKASGMTQTELAQKINMSPQNVSKWERMESLPDAITLQVIAKTLHKDISYFYSEPDDENKKFEYYNAETEPSRVAKDTPIDIIQQHRADDADFNNSNACHSPTSPENATSAQRDECSNDDSVRAVFNHNGAKWLNMDFAQVSLNNLDFKFARFVNCNFNGTDFNAGKLPYTEFFNCEMIQADLSSCELFRTDIKNCNLSDANFQNALIKQADFVNCSLSNANLCDSTQESSSFRNCDIKNTRFENLNLKSIIFKNTTFTDCVFTNCTFSECAFKHVTFTDCSADKISYNFLLACRAQAMNVKVIQSDEETIS